MQLTRAKPGNPASILYVFFTAVGSALTVLWLYFHVSLCVLYRAHALTV